MRGPRNAAFSLAALFVLAAPAQSAAQAPTTFPMGLVFAPKERALSIVPMHGAKGGKPPAEADLSEFLPPIGKQLNDNTCVGWAVGYYAHSIVDKSYVDSKRGPAVSVGPFSPSFVYNLARVQEVAAHPEEAGNGCNVGIQLEEGLSVMEGYGGLPSKDFPYKAGKCFQLPTQAQRLRAHDYVTGGVSRAVSPGGIIKAIAEGAPVVVGIQVYQNFTTYHGGIYKQVAGNIVGAHAIVVVGYSNSKHAYKIVNSWGTDWGGSEHGFAWIDYDTLEKLATVDGVLRAYAVYPKMAWQ